MADEQSDKKPTVAYVPFKTFISAVETLENGIPHVIDRTVWPSFSGVMQSQVLGAFRFLGLIDTDDKPAAILEALVESKGEDRKAVLRVVVEEAYARLVQKGLTKMSVGGFEEAMRDYSVTGETFRKACSFFLQAAKYCGIPLSNYLQKQTRNVSAIRKRRTQTNGKPKGESVADGEEESQIENPATGPIKTIELEKGITLSLSTSSDTFQMTAQDRKFVLGILETLENYESEREALGMREE